MIDWRPQLASRASPKGSAAGATVEKSSASEANSSSLKTESRRAAAAEMCATPTASSSAAHTKISEMRRMVHVSLDDSGLGWRGKEGEVQRVPHGVRIVKNHGGT